MTPINEFQSIGSHYSYRKRTYTPLFNLFSLATTILPDEWISDGIDPSIQWDYEHLPLERQFNQFGVRSLELDLYNDPEGGLYSNRLEKALVLEPIASGVPELNEPGIKIMHLAHVDYMTHYHTFKQSLETILAWSNNHPDHFPLFVLMELKDQFFPFEIPNVVDPFDEYTIPFVAQEILDIFPEEKLITPTDLRTHATLEASIAANGWPLLAEARGKTFFIIMDSEEIEETVFGSNEYSIVQNNNLFKIMDDPYDPAIGSLIDQGYMVRTRSDGGTAEARTGNTEKRDAAFASGAQIISTDYYRPDPRHLFLPNEWTDYEVQWPGGHTARSNVQRACYVD
ncbi:MAG: hypothetical protein GY751_25490 [Bacteroidetes bacterium]|nr:hypothetical protein [Bacteroidota bacterium]